MKMFGPVELGWVSMVVLPSMKARLSYPHLELDWAGVIDIAWGPAWTLALSHG